MSNKKITALIGLASSAILHAQNGEKTKKEATDKPVFNPNETMPVERRRVASNKVQKKGTKTFHFNASGQLCEESNAVFSCEALNEKNANRKMLAEQLKRLKESEAVLKEKYKDFSFEKAMLEGFLQNDFGFVENRDGTTSDKLSL